MSIPLENLPKMSETMLAFAKPLLDAAPPPPSIEHVRSAMALAMIAWNLPLYERTLDPKAASMRAMFDAALAEAGADARQVMSNLMRERLTRYANDPRLAVVEVRDTGSGQVKIVATAAIR